MVTRPVLLVLLGASVATGFVVGLLIGMYGAHPAHEGDTDESKADDPSGLPKVIGCTTKETEDAFHKNKKINRNILSDISGANIKAYLKEIADESHVAGKPGSKRVAEYIHKQWTSFGLTNVHFEKYEVLLSHPDTDNENQVVLTSAKDCGSANGVAASQTARESLKQDSDDTFPDAYFAYSPSGTVQGDVVYANYGTEEDFDQLERWKVNVTGRIVITRYGKIFRGNKVANAAARKALGMLIYPDPEEAAPNDGLVFMKGGRWMPPDALQRGTIYEKIGDPLTPGLPAKDEMYRLELDEAELPTIPSQPISYSFARRLMSQMAGEVLATPNWKGGFQNMKYRLGPKFEGQYENHTVCLSVHNELHEKDNIYNVIGVIPGGIEPDRYVIIGNPHDAWGYGYVNPASSTAQVMEIARVFGALYTKGWRPRRTIIFAAWDAGKFGQIGSTEWVEEHLPQLSARTVAYINSESCVETDEFTVSASPILKSAVLRIAKLVPARHPDDKMSIFDQWSKGDDDDDNKYADEHNPDPERVIDPDDPDEGTAHDDDDDDHNDSNDEDSQKDEKEEMKTKKKGKFTTVLIEAKKKRSVSLLEALLPKSLQKRDADGDGIPDHEDSDMDGDGIPNKEDDDVDGDGVLNHEDKDVDGDGVPNHADEDVDGDGVLNHEDDDVDGDGVLNHEDTDVDGDGVLNHEDTDVDGDGVLNEDDKDMDGDGILNHEDTDDDGDGVPDHEDDDDDADGVPDHLEGDMDGDGVIDHEDDDVDGDGVLDHEDDDVDGDGIPNKEDDDVDGDGIPNKKDDDVDGDGVLNHEDDDVDGDGVLNHEDPDVDGDGVLNHKDDDVDGDGVLNHEDDDVDGDGVLNHEDPDVDGDGVRNDKDDDMDGDGVLNHEDHDDDGDGVPDHEDDDDNADGVADHLEGDEDDDDDDDDDMDLFDTSKEDFDAMVVSSLGAESDHAAFLFYAGIPSVDIHANNEKGDDDYFPVLNTAYDNLVYFEKYVDPDMTRCVACAQYTALLARYLADSVILPFDVAHLGDIIKVAQEKVKRVEQHLKDRNITVYDEFEKAVQEFDNAAEEFKANVATVDLSSPLAVRIINDQMMQLERVFIDPKGQSDDWFQRNLVFGPSDFDKNSDSLFNVLDDLLKRRLDEIVEEEESEEKQSAEDAVDDDSDNIDIDVEETWDEVEKYVSHLRVVINQATEFLDVHAKAHAEVEDKDTSDEDSEAEP